MIDALLLIFRSALLGDVADLMPSVCSLIAIESGLLVNRFETGDDDVVPAIPPPRCWPL